MQPRGVVAAEEVVLVRFEVLVGHRQTGMSMSTISLFIFGAK